MKNPITIFSKFIFIFIVFTSCSKITEVKINPTGGESIKGKSIQLVANVKGEGNPDTTVIWSIVNKTTSGTEITKNGLLKIAENEPADSIIVKAAALKDTSKYDICKLNLLLNKELFLGKWDLRWNGNYYTEEIKLNEFSQRVSGSYYLVSNTKWIKVKNEDLATKDEFPEGYLISGLVTKSYNYSDTHQGDIRKAYYYINSDRTQLSSGNVIWKKAK